MLGKTMRRRFRGAVWLELVTSRVMVIISIMFMPIIPLLSLELHLSIVLRLVMTHLLSSSDDYSSGHVHKDPQTSSVLSRRFVVIYLLLTVLFVYITSSQQPIKLLQKYRIQNPKSQITLFRSLNFYSRVSTYLVK